MTTSDAALCGHSTLAAMEAENKRVIMFGGKGGVGKTTISSATALHYAMHGKKTLIISSDLAASLSDIFESVIGPVETKVPGLDNLWALEISIEEVMQRWKRKFGPQIYAAASLIVDMPYDEIVDYVAMAPGIQEEFMLDFIFEYIQSDRYEMVVWDTAPAGDTLRLLALPEKFLKHLRAAPRFYLKAQNMLGVASTPFLDLIDSWTELSKKIMQFFVSPDHVEFIIVTIPEGLGIAQSKRVIDELKTHGIHVKRVIVNNVIPHLDSEFLRHRYKMQQPYLKMLHEHFGSEAVIAVPLLPHEIKGLSSLQVIEKLLFTK